MRQRAIFAVQEIIQSTLSGKDDDVDGANVSLEMSFFIAVLLCVYVCMHVCIIDFR